MSMDGPAPHRRHLLTLIRAELDEIYNSFAQLEAQARVPLPERPGQARELVLHCRRRGRLDELAKRLRRGTAV